jgi:hypothetical protein
LAAFVNVNVFDADVLFTAIPLTPVCLDLHTMSPHQFRGGGRQGGQATIASVTAADPRHHHHRDHVGAGRLQRQGGLRLVSRSEGSDYGKRAIDRDVGRAVAGQAGSPLQMLKGHIDESVRYRAQGGLELLTPDAVRGSR